VEKDKGHHEKPSEKGTGSKLRVEREFKLQKIPRTETEKSGGKKRSDNKRDVVSGGKIRATISEKKRKVRPKKEARKKTGDYLERIQPILNSDAVEGDEISKRKPTIAPPRDARLQRFHRI